MWAIPPTPHSISTELQPAEGIDLKLQSPWKVLQRVGSSFTEELKPVSKPSTFQPKPFWQLFLPRVTQPKHFSLTDAEGDINYIFSHLALAYIETQSFTTGMGVLESK